MRNKGSVFIIIIAILAVIFTMATYFMSGTIEEKHQTERSQRTGQTLCLAEAALERAMGVIAKELNSPQSWKDPSSLGHLLRIPTKRTGKTSMEGLEKKLGADELLETAENFKKPIVLKKDKLQGSNGNELDQIFEFMVGKNVGASYEVEVSIKLDKGFRIAPGASVGDTYKIPGVEIPWNCHSGVKDFLNNKGYAALVLSIPEDIKWLSFYIPIKVAGVKLFSVDPMAMVSVLLPASIRNTINEILSIDALLKRFFPGIYPYKISFAKNIFPDLSQKLGSVSLPGFDDQYFIEKFGYLSVESKASITYPDKRVITKYVLASKEFKCADVEPVAPLYSFFISNLNDNRLIFNSIGGNLFVNNFMGLSNIKNDPPAGAEEKREFPGLVRVNGTNPAECNVSFIGNPSSPNLEPGDNMLKKLGRGVEFLLMMDTESKGSLGVSGKKTVHYKAEYAKYTTGDTAVPNGAKAGGTESLPKAESKYKGNPNAESDGALSEKEKKDGEKQKGSTLDGLRSMIPIVELNILPPMDFGGSVFSIPLHGLPSPIPGVNITDAWSKWEWPFMGTGWYQFTLPTTGIGDNVTHFFGSACLFPTMTREVEGFVLKRYRQWNLLVVSWPMAPIPLGNQIPVPWPPLLILPFPIPLWHTHEITSKYDYNLWVFKTPKDESGVSTENDLEVKVYDPAIQENSPPNLYSLEQYAKKATYYYPTSADFIADIPNRLITENGKTCFKLNGVNFIADSITLPPPGSDTFFISGKGAIVTGG
ncbi:hypothetical protein HYY75_05930, partial [bacterium]|nr:hypothetical protein [bacterium]